MVTRILEGKPRSGVRFTPALFGFLSDLAAHNDRAWFQENRERFEAEVREPMQAFILAFAEPLRTLSPHFLADARPSGGSLFRIFRDTRFSKDKSPYKTNVGAQFRHRDCARDVHSPGFYLHLEPGGCFMSAGLWHPDPESLRKVRERLVSHGREWKDLRTRGLAVAGEALKRVPPGFDPDHPLAEDLKLKDFYTYTPLTQRQVCAPEFLEQFTGMCRQNGPLVRFLSRALGLPY
ncbi:MAG TPA: TIGR02453 family protein [Geothrix sp.]|nr:TIGR02453 family protein [Geothrix sp.]